VKILLIDARQETKGERGVASVRKSKGGWILCHLGEKFRRAGGVAAAAGLSSRRDLRGVEEREGPKKKERQNQEKSIWVNSPGGRPFVSTHGARVGILSQTLGHTTYKHHTQQKKNKQHNIHRIDDAEIARNEDVAKATGDQHMA